MAKLSTAHAEALLNALVERLQHQPQQAGRLVPWLRNLLLTHGPGLAATPGGQVRALAWHPWARSGRASSLGQPFPCSSPFQDPSLHMAMQAALRLAQELLHQRTTTFAGLLNLAGRLQVLQAASGSDGRVGKAPPATAKVGCPQEELGVATTTGCCSHTRSQHPLCVFIRTKLCLCRFHFQLHSFPTITRAVRHI